MTQRSRSRIKSWQAAEPAKPGGLAALKEYFAGLFILKVEAAKPAVATDQLYFTNQSSFSRQPLCRDAQYVVPRPHLYLPVGVVVRKLGEVNMGEGNKKDKYWLVETEYGLKTFVKDANLSPMGREFVYFFADGAERVNDFGTPFVMRLASARV